MKSNQTNTKKEAVFQLDVIELVQKLGIDIDKLKATNIFKEELDKLDQKQMKQKANNETVNNTEA